MIGFFAVIALLLFQTPATSRLQSGNAAGTVQGLDGSPAAGVRVAAVLITDLTSTAVDGALVSLTQTDTAGRYRLENIPPGRYYIQAGLVDSPTFYPGVTRKDAATSIQILAGAAVEALDFRLLNAPGVRVSGRVPVSSTRAAMIRLAGTSGGRAINPIPIGADGSFEFLRVPPGNYTLMTLPANAAPNLTIVVKDKDIDVGTPTGPGVKVSGTLGLGLNSRNQWLKLAEGGPSAKIVLSAVASWARLEATVDGSGKFQFDSVPPGTYQVQTIPVSGSGLSLGEIVVADRELGGVVIPLFANVEGTVALQDGRNLPRLPAALMIQARSADGRPLATPIRADGTFTFPLSEGEYRISVLSQGGFTVQAITYGSTDLTKNPLKLDGSERLQELRITLIQTR